jgi:Domain of unknown function (DUF5666)
MTRTVRLTYRAGGVFAAVALSMLVAACGGSASASGGGASTASTSPTPTCPPTGTFKAVTGTISNVASNAITVAGANGAATLVHLSSSTRITRVVSTTPASLSSGTAVQVSTDTGVTSAQRIVILSGGQGGAGSFGGFGGGRRGTPSAGTPPAGANRACFQRAGQGSGTGSGQGSGFQGLRGTVDSASSTQLVLDDSQGQTFTVAITPSTVIETSAAGAQSDLSAGATVTATGTAASDGIDARAITVQAAGH